MVDLWPQPVTGTSEEQSQKGGKELPFNVGDGGKAL
jgi:hypothetical protein